MDVPSLTHIVQQDGETILIENVPANVCTVCGDVLLSLETVERIEKLLQHPETPVHTALVYKIPGNVEATA